MERGCVLCGDEGEMTHRSKVQALVHFVDVCVLCDVYILPLQKEGVG